MEQVRKPFQGVCNIIRFNWQFYVYVILFLLISFVAINYVNGNFGFALKIICFIVLFQTVFSLFVSYYIYDLSGFYKLNWINESDKNNQLKIVNINAGFDETSHFLQVKFKKSELLVYDFYDPTKHTEISIERARKAYLPYPNTLKIETHNLKLNNNSVDKIFVIFAAHEIRNEQERITFFNEMKRILKPNGEIIVVEHLRDFPNFIAFNIGFLHFYSKSTWQKTINLADLKFESDKKITAFTSIFTITKNGITS